LRKNGQDVQDKITLHYVMQHDINKMHQQIQTEIWASQFARNETRSNQTWQCIVISVNI